MALTQVKKLPEDHERWMSEFKRGKAKAFEHIFYEFHSAVCFFANGFLNDKEASKDLVSEVFIKLWNKHADFNSLYEVKSFLYISTRNACLNYIKGLKVASDHQKWLIQQTGLEEMEDFVMKRILDAEVARELNDAIGSLPTQCRRVMLESLEGLKTEEIAQKLGLSPQTVRNTRNRATQLLKERLSPGMMAIAICFFLMETAMLS